jgi:hypothetical protein
MKGRFVSGEHEDDVFTICVNLGSDFANKFFGEDFVSNYNNYVKCNTNK